MGDTDFRIYRQRVLWGPFQDVTPADLDVVEQTIGRPLPADYREFIAMASGATLPYAVRLPPGQADGELLEFSSLTQVHGDRSLATAWNEFKDTVMAEHLPSTMLEVARDGGGSTLYLDLGSESPGSVWAYVFGLPAWTGSHRQSNTGGQVAASWNDYLDMLVLDEDHAREVWEESQVDPDDQWTAAVEAWLETGLPRWRDMFGAD